MSTQQRTTNGGPAALRHRNLPLLLLAARESVISVPIMAVMMHIGQSARLMGELVISLRHRVFGWAATAVMAAAVGFMLVTGV